MEFDFDISRALGASRSNNGAPTVLLIEEKALTHPRWGESLRDMLDKIGERSRRAQGLSKAVTSGHGATFKAGCRVYVLVAGCMCFGILKVGPKRLFVVQAPKEGLVEINPLCVLDFYVVEGHQRAGLGRTLFSGMRSSEGVAPEQLAYDRPSPKLLGFLKKHFGLARFHAQANNFVVFDAYFALHRRPSKAPVTQSDPDCAGRTTPGLPRRSLSVGVRPHEEPPAAPNSSRIGGPSLASLPPRGPPVEAARMFARLPDREVQAPGAPSPVARLHVQRSTALRSCSDSPLKWAARFAMEPSPSPLVQAMAQGLRV